MRSLVLVVVLVLVWCSAAAQQLPGKFVSEDGELTLFLDEPAGLLEAHVMIGYGLIFPIEAHREGDTFIAWLAGDIGIEGVLDGDALDLTLRQDGREETLTLTRQVARPEPPGDAALLTMLALVPDTAVARIGGVPGLSFADFGAALGQGGGGGPRSREQFAAMTEQEHASWVGAFRRLQAGPPDLRQYAQMMIESMPDLLGFEYFAIEQALGYGVPPNLGTVLAVEAEPPVLAGRLAERGFEEAVVEGVTVWHRQADGQIDLGGREPGDPFVGPLGMSARVAVLPGHLAGARYWSMTRAVVATFRQRYPSLAESPDYRTLAQAIAEGEGTLIQAQFLGPLDAGFLPDDPFRALTGEAVPAAPGGDVLEPYGLAVLADRQEGPDQVALIALLYQDAETAVRAAAVLAERLTGFRTEVLESMGGRLDPPWAFSGDAGFSAAVVSVRYPLPAAGATEARPGAVFSMWLQALVLRDFDVLRIGP